MKSKLKMMVTSFLIMMIIDLVLSPDLLWELGIHSPHIGLLFISGLLFGPYGAFGAVLANILLDLRYGFTPIEIIPSAIISFGVSYLAYKLWYSGFKTDKITKPILDNTYHLCQFLLILAICGLIYSACHGILIGFITNPEIDEYSFVSYFMNFFNMGFIFGILSIWLSKKIDFIATPKTSKKHVNERLYKILFSLLMIVTLLSVCSLVMVLPNNFLAGEITLIGILLYAYLTKPFGYTIQHCDENTIIEKIIQNFLIITLTIAILGVLISIYSFSFITHMNHANIYLLLMPALIITDMIIILFFIPGIIILRYIEKKVIQPVSSFSKIEGFIAENEKIETDGLLSIYSEYVDEKNEIGTLARSYSELIKHNNNYIENIRQIEGEKERINAELNIATNIQAAALPTEAIENENFIVDGYSHPAREVGGDFFDYYQIDDDNLAIVIGDVSGKGVPAALIAMVTQVIIRQMLKFENDPSKLLNILNNQMCENNPETMFVTLWLGIYNKTTKKIIFSNAGHNPPLIKENGEFKFLNILSGIVLGIMEDYEYVLEEIQLTDEMVLYTDGITDANNKDDAMYGEGRFINFFNGFESDEDPIVPLLKDIRDFTKDAEQYDDMTLLYMKIK